MSITKNFLKKLSIIPKPVIQLIWKRATINEINQHKNIQPCPFCKSAESDFIHRWWINDHFGLFDRSHFRLEIIYGDFAFPKFPVILKNYYRSLVFSWISSLAYIDYRRCKKCDLVFQNYPHTPDSANYYYSTLYRIPYSDTDENGCSIYGRSDDKIIRQHYQIGEYFLKRTGLPKGLKIIDIGCAEGNTCKYLEREGYSVYGIEVSIPMTNYAKNVLELENVTCGTYSVDSYPESFFDGIITHHVAEHVVDINNFFESLSKHLKKGGFLLLQVPCLDNIKSDDHRNHILQGGHIYGFSEKFLRTIIEKEDFRIIEIKKTPCNLNELNATERTPWDTSTWADDPCGISILAEKR